MFECLYGFTPFACDDRHNTKLKILKHKSTLEFPRWEPPFQPSREAIDLIMQLLVEKERRLCSRRYQLNDYTTQFIAGRPIRFPADKTNKNYQGHFVYADDADDLKRHSFFRQIQWDQLLCQKPPFQPKVKNWEDTKYFDDDQSISDIDESSSEDGDELVAEKRRTVAAPGSKASQHYQEDQHIVPSMAIMPDGICENPLMPVPANHAGEKVQDTLATKSKSKKTKEPKRPRDKILRDPKVGKVALQARKDGAFMGYAYRKAKGVQDVINEVVESHYPEWAPGAIEHDLAHEKRVFLEARGQMEHAGQGLLKQEVVGA